MCNIPKIHQVNHALNLFLSLSSTQTLTLTSRKPSCSDLPIPGDLTRHPISIHVSSPSHPTRRVVTSRRESRPSFFPLPSVRVPHLPRPQSPLARTAPPSLLYLFPLSPIFFFFISFSFFPFLFPPFLFFLFFLFLFSPSLLPLSLLCLAPPLAPNPARPAPSPRPAALPASQLRPPPAPLGHVPHPRTQRPAPGLRLPLFRASPRACPCARARARGARRAKPRRPRRTKPLARARPTPRACGPRARPACSLCPAITAAPPDARRAEPRRDARRPRARRDAPRSAALRSRARSYRACSTRPGQPPRRSPLAPPPGRRLAAHAAWRHAQVPSPPHVPQWPTRLPPLPSGLVAPVRRESSRQPPLMESAELAG